MKLTRQRLAIVKCLSAAGRPLSVEEILRAVKKEISTINLSTIYRNLKLLSHEGKIELVEIPGENTRYKIPQKKHLHYFFCDDCTKLFTIEGCPKGLSEVIPKGFILRGHSITFNGHCPDCS